MAALGKLQTNIPRCGRLKAVYYAKSKNPEYQDQIKIVGNWEAEGEGQFWLALSALQAFTNAGVVAEVVGQVDKDGFAKFQVISQQQRIMIVKREDGNRKVTEVQAINDLGQAVTLPPQPYPPVLNKPTPAATAAAPAAAAAPVAPVVTGAVAPPAPGGAAPATPATRPAAAPPVTAAGATAPEQLGPEELKARTRRGWVDLEERYACALAIAARSQLKLAKARDPELTLANIPLDVLQSAAATVFIQSAKDMLPVMHGLSKALFQELSPGAQNGSHPKPAGDRGVSEASRAIATSPLGPPVPAGQADAFDEPPLEEEDDLPF